MTIARLLLGGLLIFGTACTSTPSKPTPPNPGPDPGPVVQNTPPTIGAFRAQGSRTGQPANFADLGESIALSVTVTDPESAASGLTFNWASTIGTFSGTGPSVTWRAPASATTPMDVTLALEVVETYQSARTQRRESRDRVDHGKPPQFHSGSQRPRETIPPRLFELESQRRLRDAELRAGMLRDRSRDRATSPTIVWTSRSSSRTSGTPTRASDSAARARTGTAPETRVRACRSIWKSRAKRDLYDSRGRLVLREGETTVATGIDQVAAMSYPSQKRWRLCDSAFQSGSTSLADTLKGLVP